MNATKNSMNATKRSALALLSLLLLAAMSLPIQSQETGGDEHQEASAEQSEPAQQQQVQAAIAALREAQTALLETGRAIRAQAETQAEQERARREGWDSPSVIVQIGLLLVGAAYTLFALLQWSAIRRQAGIANDTLNETRKAAAAAWVAALATADSVRVSRDNQHLAYRPWIVTDKMQLPKGLMGDGKATEFEVHLINCGATPALKVKAKFGWCLEDNSWVFPKDPEYAPERTRVHDIGVIGPGRFQRSIDKLDERAEVDLFDVGQHGKILCIYGRIEYWGTFNLPDPYVTTFCYQWQRGTNAFWMASPYNSAT
jgi:hypothetical protein